MERHGRGLASVKSRNGGFLDVDRCEESVRLPRLSRQSTPTRKGEKYRTRNDEETRLRGNDESDRVFKRRLKKRRQPKRISDDGSLSLLDERVLILCQSALQRTWARNQASAATLEYTLTSVYGHEANYAAIQIQRVYKGYRQRCRFTAPDGPRHQHAAQLIQFALRRLVLARRVWYRWMWKRHKCATRIQSWYRGCRCRDQRQMKRARAVVTSIVLFQRRFRGYRFWNLVAELLRQRRSNAAIEIQRWARGVAARERVKIIRRERLRFAQGLQAASDLHRHRRRCPKCNPESCTEEGLFQCFMARYVGLHDFAGAKQLGQEGIQKFPLSATLHFAFAVLLQAMGEDLEVAMTFLRKAQVTLQVSEEQLSGCERYFLSSLQLRKDDIASLVDLAIFSQCCGKLTRAEVCYCLALDQQPLDYMIPGYLHRVHMVDRLLLNYHRFCSVFNMHQTNILAKVIPIARRCEQVRFMVSRFNQFTVIAPADENNLCRFNSVFLTDEEVYQILVEHEKKENSENGSFVNESYQDVVAMKYLTAHASMRTNTKTSSQNVHRRSTIQKVDEAKDSITLLFQPRFQGLRVRPAFLAGVAEARSKLRVSRENAERLLKDLVFIAPDDDIEQQQPASVHRVVLHLSVLKRRHNRRREMAESFALVNIQRMFRGFRVRARIRREKLLQSIHQQQVDELYARLHHNYVIRERRRTSAIAIQRIFKGYAQRRLLSRWHQGAENIQRMYRGHRGRKRAIAFRDGNHTFYMSERVFQRGMNIGGHQVMLIIDKCDLSFRLEAFDMSRCTTYPGFVSHESAMGLLRYCNWSYAQSLIGREVVLHGNLVRLSTVAFINSDDGECILTYAQVSNHGAGRLVTLSDCIQAINLHNLAKLGREAEILPLPLNPDDSGRLTEEIAKRLELTPSIPVATKELKKKAPGSLILALQPPAKVHYTFNKSDSISIVNAATVSGSQNSENNASVSNPLLQQIVFPQVDGLRGVSIGKKHFRKKCHRHAAHFTRCRCVLPLVSTSAHIEAIQLALVPPPTTDALEDARSY